MFDILFIPIHLKYTYFSLFDILSSQFISNAPILAYFN